MKKLKLISLILAVLMVASMLPFAGMLTAFAEEQLPEATTDWYTKETTDATPYELEINNVDDLFAFVAKLNEGTVTEPAFLVKEANPDDPHGPKIEKQLTVKLNADIFLNVGWDAITATKSEDIKVPAVKYPIKTGAYFGGIFDGQGHVLSGMYVDTNAQYTSLFGNVGAGYTATVKNVIVLNSFIQGSVNGIGAIFGQIDNNSWQQDHARYGLPTRGYIENVYVEASVSGTGQGRSNLGVGGLVGGSRAGLTVTNAAFVGNVFGGPRGTAALCGQTRGQEVGGVDGNYYPSRVDVVVNGFYSQAHVVGSNYTEFPNEPQSGAAGLVGYANNGNEHFNFNNIICNNTFGTEQLDADGNEVLVTSTSKDSGGNIVDEWEGYCRTGYFYGFNFSGTAKSNNVASKLPDGTANPAVIMEPQVWNYNNAFYVKTTPEVKYQTAVYALQTTARYTINGTFMDWSYDKETGIGPLFKFTDYDPAKPAKDMLTDVVEIGYWGQVRKNQAGKELYAHGGEYQSQLLMNKFNDECSLTIDDAKNWTATLADKAKLTGWNVWNNMPLPQDLINMLDKNEAAEKQSATPTADTNWYANETTDATPNELTIYNADDLLGFAAAINAGTDFAGKTVKLAANVTLNKDWDAFAATVTAPATVWPLTACDKKFAGTFDGQGNTISGIYLKATGEGVGIFGNVATGTVGTVKNVQILNSYVEGNNNATGGIFGEVDDETTAAKITDATYVNKTKAVVDNVYANINVNNAAATGNTNLGTGGIIGGSRADVLITNTVFDGKVVGGCRGVAAFVGAVRPFQNGANYYLNTITIKNSYAKGTLEGKNSNNQSFVGGAVGYSNSNTTIHVLDNVIMDCVVLGNLYLGGIYGGAWCAANTDRDGVTSDAQVWDMTNVFFTLPEGTQATGGMADTNGRNNSIIKINGKTVDGDKNAKGAAIDALKTTDVAATAKTLNWSNANGTYLPTSVYNSFYVGVVGQSVTLTKDLSLNIYIKTDGSAAVMAGEFQLGDAEDAYEVVSENVGNNTLKFTLTGIKPYQMGETVKFTTEGYEVETTVKDYLVGLLAEDAELAAAMLRWGAASQTVAEYKTDALVTAGIELPAEVDTTAGLVNDAATSGTGAKEAENFFKGVTMYVEDGVLKVEIKMFMKDVTGRQGIEVKIEGREDVYLDYQEITIVETENRTYTAIFSNLDISNMNDDIVMTILENSGGNILSKTYTTDMDDLVKTYLDSSAADADKALVKAMHAVGAALAE